MKRIIGIESATHVLILLFTLTSWANIRAFLIGAGHDALAAALLSGALGAALAVISLAISRLDIAIERQAFAALAIVGGGMALLSGALQAAEYSRHLGVVWAVALGFGIPVLGEIGLSLASALFSRAERKSDLRRINTKIEAAIVGNLDAAIAAFDPSTIRRHVERALNVVALRAVSGVKSDLLSAYGAVDSEPLPMVEAAPLSTTGATVEQLAAARTAKKNAKMEKVFALIECGDRTLNQLADEARVSSKTISRYIDEFRSSGHNIEVNGVVKRA